jgi:hypothetical protein
MMKTVVAIGGELRGGVTTIVVRMMGGESVVRTAVTERGRTTSVETKRMMIGTRRMTRRMTRGMTRGMTAVTREVEGGGIDGVTKTLVRGGSGAVLERQSLHGLTKVAIQEDQKVAGTVAMTTKPGAITKGLTMTDQIERSVWPWARRAREAREEAREARVTAAITTTSVLTGAMTQCTPPTTLKQL